MKEAISNPLKSTPASKVPTREMEVVDLSGEAGELRKRALSLVEETTPEVIVELEKLTATD